LFLAVHLYNEPASPFRTQHLEEPVVGPFAAFMRDEIEVTRSSLKLRFGLFDEAEVEAQEEKDEVDAWSLAIYAAQKIVSMPLLPS
jgi:hypothetical protein